MPDRSVRSYDGCYTCRAVKKKCASFSHLHQFATRKGLLPPQARRISTARAAAAAVWARASSANAKLPSGSPAAIHTRPVRPCPPLRTPLPVDQTAQCRHPCRPCPHRVLLSRRPRPRISPTSLTARQTQASSSCSPTRRFWAVLRVNLLSSTRWPCSPGSRSSASTTLTRQRCSDSLRRALRQLCSTGRSSPPCPTPFYHRRLHRAQSTGYLLRRRR